MMTQSESKKKAVRLSADHFSFNEKGALIINNDEIASAVQASMLERDDPEAGTIKATLSVTIGK